MKNLKLKIKQNNAITLVALVITIIILLILAGISIAQLTDNGLFEKAKLSKEVSKNAQDDEDDKIKQYGNEIDIQSSSNRLTGGSGRKTIIWSTNASGTREVNLDDYNCKITDFDFLIVYYMVAGNSSGSIIMDTSADYTYNPAYTYGNNYCLTNISTNISTNKVNMSVSANNDWSKTNYSYLKMIMGVNL